MGVKDKKIPIKYTSRDFNSIKRDLEDYARRYYPDTYKDFSEASFGSLMVDTVAYIGDILSYYVDYSVNESFFDTAIEYNNVLRHARRLGYKYVGRASATGIVSLYVMVPANSLGLGPDRDYIPLVKRGTTFRSQNGVGFMLVENVDFSNSAATTVVGRVNTSTGVPTHYAVRMFGRVVSGGMTQETKAVGPFERFKKVPIKNKNFSELLSVIDSDGNEYFEVENLSHNLVYREYSNPNFSADGVASIIKPVVVARRFTVERDSLSNVHLQFGFGSEEDIKLNKIADPSDVVINALGKSYVTSTNFDPYKLLNTDKFGIAPANTTLTISYRTNNRADVNVGSNSIKSVTKTLMEFRSPQRITELPIVGDSTVPSTDELRIRAKDYFATQGRAVTAKDYEAFAYAMPGKFGSIKRCKILTDNVSLRRNLNLYVISEDHNGNFAQANDTIKNNLKTWLSQNRMINDTIDILDAQVVNLGIEYKVKTDLNSNRFEVLEKCTSILKKEYDVKYLIGQPFEISRIMKLLNKVDGVIAVVSVEVVQREGTSYSSVSFPIDSMRTADGRFISAPKNVVFELKFPDADIRGSIT